MDLLPEIALTLALPISFKENHCEEGRAVSLIRLFIPSK